MCVPRIGPLEFHSAELIAAVTPYEYCMQPPRHIVSRRYLLEQRQSYLLASIYDGSMSKSYETDRKPLGHVPPVPSTTPSVSPTTHGTRGTRGAYRTPGACCLPRPNEFVITVNRGSRLIASRRVTLIPARLALGRYLIRGSRDPPERLVKQ